MDLFVHKQRTHPHAFQNILGMSAKARRTFFVRLMPVVYIFGIDTTGVLAQ